MRLKRRTGKFREIEEYNKRGRDFKEVMRNYAKYTTRTEFIIFAGIPVFISLIVFVYFGCFEESNKNLLSYIVDMNKISLTVIAILAGFNTTSLSIIAASNNKVLKYLKQQKTQNKNDSILKQLVSFFSFAILIQLLVLILGVILSVVSNNFFDVSVTIPFLKGFIARLLLSVLGIIWLSAVLFTIMISIRNATLLYRYVLFIADYEDID